MHTKYNWNVVIYRYFPIVWSGVNQDIFESGENRAKMLKHKDSLKGIFPVVFVGVPCCAGNLVFIFILENKVICI